MPAAKKSAKSALFLILFLIAIAIVAGGSIYLANHLSTTKPVAQTCTTVRANHRVIIRQGVVTPSHTTAKRCDSLTITNLDATNRLMAFGTHEDHRVYDGIEERLLGHEQSLKVILVQSGSFRFHDHLDDTVQGTFTVSKD
jgi:hypothetical protein